MRRKRTYTGAALLKKRERQAAYLRTAKGKATQRRYLNSAKGKASAKKYDASEKRRIVARRYNVSPKGQARARHHRDRRIWVRRQYCGLAVTPARAQQIRAHIRKRWHELKQGFSAGEKTEGLAASSTDVEAGV